MTQGTSDERGRPASGRGDPAGAPSRFVMPSADLRAWVRCYLVRNDSGPVGHGITWLPASAGASLHFVFDGSSVHAHSGQRRAWGPQVFVAGPQGRVVVTRSTSPLSTVSVILWPGALHRFGVLSATALADDFVTADSTGLRGLLPLLERMAQTSRGMGLRALEEELRALLRGREETGADMPFRGVQALHLIRHLRNHGPTSTAAQAGLSARQFERRFHLQFGTTPKLAQRLVRFDRLLSLTRMRGLARGQLADLALELGYYDQSHLNNEFKTFAGFAPLALPRQAEHGAAGSWLYRAGGPIAHFL